MKDVHGHSNVVPGEDTSIKSKMMHVGSAMMEKFTPINQICDHLIGFHCYSDDIKRQVIAHHYCSQVNEDFRQCIIYDSDKADAKLIGIEYIVSDNIFKTFSEEEKKFWHSHVFEIKSGMLTSPNSPYTMEHEVMKVLITTYGKTIHLWQIDRGDKLPLGEPKVMMAPVNENLVNWDLIKKRDELYGIDHKQLQENRKDISDPIIDAGADQWSKTGKGIRLEPRDVNLDISLSRIA